jgi:hypothetical protein
VSPELKAYVAELVANDEPFNAAELQMLTNVLRPLDASGVKKSANV